MSFFFLEFTYKSTRASYILMIRSLIQRSNNKKRSGSFHTGGYFTLIYDSTILHIESVHFILTSILLKILLFQDPEINFSEISSFNFLAWPMTFRDFIVSLRVSLISFKKFFRSSSFSGKFCNSANSKLMSCFT